MEIKSNIKWKTAFNSTDAETMKELGEANKLCDEGSIQK
jgi:hypothetical protein